MIKYFLFICIMFYVSYSYLSAIGIKIKSLDKNYFACAVTIQNSFNKDIYVTIFSGQENDFGYEEYCGGVGISHSKSNISRVIYFNAPIKIKWSEDYKEESHKWVEFNTEEFKKYSNQIKEIIFIYYGNNKWKMQLHNEAPTTKTSLFLKIDGKIIFPVVPNN